MDDYTLTILTQIKLALALRDKYTNGSRRWLELTGEIAGLSRALYFYTGRQVSEFMEEHNRLMEAPTVAQEVRHGRSA